ncbi:hypothetical protein [Bacillus nitroreducens]
MEAVVEGSGTTAGVALKRETVIMEVVVVKKDIVTMVEVVVRDSVTSAEVAAGDINIIL